MLLRSIMVRLVVLGEKLGREVYKATAPTATSTVADLYLTAGVELFYDQTVAHYLPEWVNEPASLCAFTL